LELYFQGIFFDLVIVHESMGLSRSVIFVPVGF